MISLLNLKNLWEWAFNLNYWIKNRIGGSPSRPFTYFQLAVVCIRRKIIQKDTKNGDYIRLDTLLPIFFSHKIATVGIKPVMCWSFQIKTWHSNNGVGAEVNVKENRIEPWVHYRRTNRIMDFFWGGGRSWHIFWYFYHFALCTEIVKLHILGGGGTPRLNLNICTCWHSDLTTLWQTSWGDKGQERQERGGK